MSLSSKKTRKQLRRSWLQHLDNNLVVEGGADAPGAWVSFTEYKQIIHWDAIQKAWNASRGKQAPHQQGRSS